MSTAADAVLEQQLELLRAENAKLRGQFEQFKMVCYLIALQSGMDWKDLCKRAQGRMEARLRVRLQREEAKATDG